MILCTLSWEGTPEIQRIREAAESQLKKIDEVIASNEAIAEAIAEVEAQLAHGFSMVANALQDLCSALDDRFQEMIDILYFQSEMLKEFKEILERPLDTQAKELRKRGEVAYLNGWFDEAEIDLLEAEKKNYQDFVVHHILGNIYFYHKTDHAKALEYYQKSAKYATAFSKDHASNVLLCVAMVYYKVGRLADAYTSTKRALELTPNDPRALYHHARYAAKMGYIDEFLNVLKECVYKEPKYLITADADDMLSGAKDEVRKLAKDLRNEKKREVSDLIQMIASAKEEAKTLGIRWLVAWDKKVKEVNELITPNSYLDLLKAKEIGQNVLNEIYSFLKKEVEGSGAWKFCWKYWILSVLTILIGNAMEDGGGHWFWSIFSLLFAPFVVPLVGIYSVLLIFLRTLGIIHEIREPITVVVLYLFSGIVLPILLFLWESIREEDRLMAIDDKLERFKNMGKRDLKKPLAPEGMKVEGIEVEKLSEDEKEIVVEAIKRGVDPRESLERWRRWEVVFSQAPPSPPGLPRTDKKTPPQAEAEPANTEPELPPEVEEVIKEVAEEWGVDWRFLRQKYLEKYPPKKKKKKKK